MKVVSTAHVVVASETRVLVVAPTKRDAEMCRAILGKAGIDVFLCADLSVVSRELRSGAAALVLTEEVIADRLADLSANLDDQPAWSDLPVVLLTKGGAESQVAALATERLDNVLLLERPVQPLTLVTAVRAAIKNRRRQYELRNYLVEQQRDRQALGAANEQLADADQRKNEFIAILSHELRNPLAPVRYALPLLQAQPLDDNGRQAVAVINRQVDHLTRLVDDLLDVSRITRGKIELRCEHAALGPILSAAVEAASPALAAARHTLQFIVPEEPIWVYADRARIAQVVTNLLNNSAKFTPRGGTILLEAAADDGHAAIRVRDNGMGISSDALSTVFEMFRQANRSAASQGGLGIGLALVKRLVEMHGGTVEAFSGGTGQGAEFVVKLPISTAAPAPSASQTAPALGAARRLRVLVVDDNVDLVDMLALVVTNAGHDVRKALDGRTAIAAALVYLPDVILLDLGLPVMSGIEVAQALRQHAETMHTPLVALTGWGQAEDRKRTKQAGFAHHLTKPTDPQELQQLLSAIAAAPTGE